jgi:signal transduction histidine kinase/CheY-like chemotaxis protein
MKEHWITLSVSATCMGLLLAGWILRRSARPPSSKTKSENTSNTEMVVTEQLREAKKMEALGRLAGGIAHDFNNVLTAIMGYSDMILQNLGENHPCARDVKEIRTAGKRAATLTKQLLAFSRRQVMELKVLDLNSLVTNVSKMLRPIIGEHNRLMTELCPNLGSIRADAGQIEQVIMNLVINARDAMPRGGKIILRTGNVDLDDSSCRKRIGVRPGPYVTLQVEDNGSGIDSETKAHLFEPFFTTKESGKGTGLGLSMVHGIVIQSGGCIDVESEPGEGTRFTIYLPRSEETAVAEKPSTANVGPLEGTETVLLVEDEQALRALARRVLGVYGYTILEAGNGEEALAVAERHKDPIHILVTDMVMPKMSGDELRDRVIQIHPETRVLFMSGYTGGDKVLRNGFGPRASFLQKPFTPRTLLRKIREVLQDIPN